VLLSPDEDELLKLRRGGAGAATLEGWEAAHCFSCHAYTRHQAAAAAATAATAALTAEPQLVRVPSPRLTITSIAVARVVGARAR
jgi:hypothetical protein